MRPMPPGKKTAPKKPAKTVKNTAPKNAPAMAGLAERLAGVAIPPDAWALTRVERGVGVTPHIDNLLALGFPCMISVVDEPLPSTDAKKALRTFDISRVVPRAMVARLYAYKRAEGDPATAANAGEVFASEPAPIELAAVVDRELRARDWSRVWLLEAMFGSTAVAEAFVDAYERLPDEKWFVPPLGAWGNIAIKGLGSVIDRTPAATRERLRARLDALFARLDARDGHSRALRGLDVILHGRAGYEAGENSGSVSLGDYHWARDDRAWIESRVLASAATWTNRDRIWFDAQLAFAGGPTVLAKLREVAAANIVMKDHREAVNAQLALFA